LALCSDADLSKGWLTFQKAKIAGAEVYLFRVSFAGELGWEVHSPIGDTAKVWDAVMQAGAPLGLKPFGMFALNSLRVEKGYRAWKGDLSTDYTILQGGLERFVDWAKPEFRGKAALEAEKQRGVSKRFCTLVIEAGEQDPPYMSTIWHKGQVVGELTSGYYGHRVGACIGLGMLKSDVNVAGTAVEVEIFGTRYPAVVQEDQPLWDAKNERIRA
jgi:dimethylglycine dehydrogenase